MVLFKVHLHHLCLREEHRRAILTLLAPSPLPVEVQKHESSEIGDRQLKNVAGLATRLGDLIQLLQVEPFPTLGIFQDEFAIRTRRRLAILNSIIHSKVWYVWLRCLPLKIMGFRIFGSNERSHEEILWLNTLSA